jgi:hypothetical protein
MALAPEISLIVPTRGRPQQLATFLASVAATASQSGRVEVVLVIDADDPESPGVPAGPLRVKRVIVPPGLTMGGLNTAGYEASSGRFLMLLNDDVICRTSGWDDKIRACFQCCADDILLVHVNDTLMQTALCTFPVVSRAFCEVAGGICPREYVRYRIDDHIEDIFNLLGVLGERRTVYLPEVVFEHGNFEERVLGLRQYFADDAILARDAPTFDRLADDRKALALRLRERLEPGAARKRKDGWQRRLAGVSDPFALRVPGRLRVVTDFSRTGLDGLRHRICTRRPEGSPSKLWLCLRQRGVAGLVRALVRRAMVLGTRWSRVARRGTVRAQPGPKRAASPSAPLVK